MLRLTLPLALFVSLLPVEAASQSAGLSDRGSYSIAFGVGSSLTLGQWFRLGVRTDAGLEAGVHLGNGDDRDERVVSVQPSLKVYWGATDATVAPYAIVGFTADWNWLDAQSGSFTRDFKAFGGLVGLGMSWFVHERISLSGHVALHGRWTSQAESRLGLPDQDLRGFEARTMSSGLRFHFYP